MVFALVTAICACFFPTFFAFIKRKPKVGTWTIRETFLVLVFVLASGWSWGQILLAILKTHPETLILGKND
jgi:hypothetical protein